jgi:hypothetical protein
MTLIDQILGRSPSDADADAAQGNDKDLRRVNQALVPALAVTGLVLLITGARTGAVGPTFLWGISSLAAGAAIGFLFGIPRVSRGATEAKPQAAGGGGGASENTASAPAADPAIRPNTNLEEVSDWLTKIIVGLGLVHLGDIERLVQRTAGNAAAAMAQSPGAAEASIATALIVGLAIEGFFGGYIYTRLFLQGAFARSDAQLDEARRRIGKVVDRTQPEEAADAGQARVPSAAQIKTATEVERLAEGDPRAAIEKMNELAAEYERVRSSMASGPDRTRQMRAVVARMTVVALGAAGHLAQFSASVRPGERLAAVVILQLRFDPAYSAWLAQRLVEDRPFIGFQAASALLAGSRLVGGTHLEALRAAVAEASQTLEAKGWKNDPARDRIIDEILAPPQPPAAAAG